LPLWLDARHYCGLITLIAVEAAESTEAEPLATQPCSAARIPALRAALL
jgi:hypothetical protein